MPSDDTIARISRLKPSDLAADVLAAVEALGGEAQRAEIIDRALDIGGWSADERAVVSWYTGAARKYHLRTLADYAVTTCRERGDLVEGSSRGRWRLPGGAKVEPHPAGRAFIAGVGTYGRPVSDDWSAAEQSHIWFRHPSRKLRRGDHVFALAAGRGSAVLGLFEVTSAGTTTLPPNPEDPERWPYVVHLRPLAGVPPVLARPVPQVIAPRGTANRVEDPARQAALYAAVSDPPVAASAAPQRDDAVTAPRLRQPRRFDPSRPPAPAEAAASVLGPEEVLARQEKARQAHHALLARLHEQLTAAGWRDLEEIPAAIDLRGTSPTAMRVIFEAKTISDSNETSQCRAALAQLLEYRLDYGHPDDHVCVVVDAEPSPRRLEVLDRLGVAVIQADDDRLLSLNEAGTMLLQDDAV
jgi:hypothetical protein